MGRYIDRKMRDYNSRGRERRGERYGSRNYERPYERVYERSYNDYNTPRYYTEPQPMYYNYDYESRGMESEYHEKVKHLIDKLERYDKFKLSKQEILNQAKQMGAKFHNYNEDDFLAVYYMLMSDHKADMLNSPQIYEIMAKEWLEDDDVSYSGEDKLLAYIDCIIEGD